MNVKMLTVGSLFTNCYVVWPSSAEDAVVVDPGFNSQEDAAEILGILEDNSLRVRFILNTHGHPDHTSGNEVLKNALEAPVLIHRLDAQLLRESSEKRRRDPHGFRQATSQAIGFLENNGFVEFGRAALRVLHTPGHTPGSVSLVGGGCVFTGDTLFAGSIGRTDLPGGSNRDIMKSLREKLAALPDSFRVYPGHGPCSQVGREKRTNPFLQRGFDSSFPV
jgi:glyoxylase-like metal-dependent hydrolase (beta-lactamase superfamily II)